MSWNQPECNCGAPVGQKHQSSCNALKPANERDPQVEIDSQNQTRDDN